MRHFRDVKLVLACSIAGLARRLEAPSSELDSVPAACTPKRISPALEAAAPTEPLTPIATAAKTKLDPTKPAHDEPIAFQRHGAPGRRILDMELRL